MSDRCDTVTVGNADRCRWGIIGEGKDRGSTMAVVMACSSVGDGCEVAVVVYLQIGWATGCISSMN